MPQKISVIIPVLNEGKNIAVVYTAVKDLFPPEKDYLFELLFIDDGSTDDTLKNIAQIAAIDPNVLFVSFSRNFGKDNALCAGFRKSTGDAVITMDADMQHSPLLIKELIEKWESGYEVIYYYRENKQSRMNIFSLAFYKALNMLSDVKLENGISDFRLMDRKVVNALVQITEDKLFYRGLIKWIGFKQIGIPYIPSERNSGTTRYRTGALVKLAVNSIISFSTKPLTIAIYLGFIFSLLSALFIPYAIYSKIHHLAISGWASVIVTIAFFGGLNLMILGIVGLYLGKTFMQGKNRPLYIISQSNIESL